MDERPYSDDKPGFTESVRLTYVNPRAPPEFVAGIEAIAKRIAEETGPVPPLPDDA